MRIFLLLVVLTTSLVIHVDAACNAATLTALYAFYHATGGPNWYYSSNWLDPTIDPCETKNSDSE